MSEKGENRGELIRDENRRIRVLRFLTDLTRQRICTEDINGREAFEAIEDLKRVAVRLFPDKGDVFDLVIAPRLLRDCYERFGPTCLPETH